MLDSPDPEVVRLEADSVRLAMEQAWRDHHHARDQTWKSVQIEAALAAGLIGIDIRVGMPTATICTALLVVLAAVSGMMITLHHRRLEIRKFRQILACEDWLGLGSLIGDVGEPAALKIWDIFRLGRTNTALFILRMHFSIAVFAIIFAIARWPR